MTFRSSDFRSSDQLPHTTYVPQLLTTTLHPHNAPIAFQKLQCLECIKILKISRMTGHLQYLIWCGYQQYCDNLVFEQIYVKKPIKILPFQLPTVTMVYTQFRTFYYKNTEQNIVMIYNINNYTSKQMLQYALVNQISRDGVINQTTTIQQQVVIDYNQSNILHYCHEKFTIFQNVKMIAVLKIQKM
eukprot:TRINITY_DN13087_c0_g1_i1.p1 TRINITY_DN13087_c0_g1~~TRINITY_DN13087_c0_g1_i1.p1  ORF type:complete len:187 (-),score=-11.35 TRINITY_DN13087_c0_g1_i1:563-1123(-)